MVEQSYNLSFTASSLRQQDTLKLASLYLQYKDWDVVRDEAIKNNMLQQRTTSSAKRICQELVLRLKHLSEEEIRYLVNCPESEKAILLWVSVCRHYPFIHDFAVEVLREHLINLNHQIDYSDFDVFFSTKLGLHDELDTITVSTHRKIRQVLFRMLREAGLLSHDNTINAILPNPSTVNLLERSDLEVIGLLHTN